MIEKNVCSLKFSNMLKELKIKQESIFYWVYDEKNDINEVCMVDYPEENYISAFIATELLELIIEEIKQHTEKQLGDIQIYYPRHEINVLKRFYVDYDDFRYRDHNLCDALAKMLLYLIEYRMAHQHDDD